MVICPDCGKEVTDAKFCSNCGATLKPHVEETADAVEDNAPAEDVIEENIDIGVMEEHQNDEIEANIVKKSKFCSNCGREVDVDIAFCPQCGYRFDENNVIAIYDAEYKDVALIDAINAEEKQITVNDIIRGTVVLNIESLDRASSIRLIDFLLGAVHVLGGDMKSVTKTTLVFAPRNVGVSDFENLEDVEESEDEELVEEYDAE